MDPLLQTSDPTYLLTVAAVAIIALLLLIIRFKSTLLLH